MWIEVVNILAGLVLCAGILGAIPAMGKHLEKLAKWLGGFQTIIGLIAIILAVLWWTDLQSIVAIIVGLILIVGLLPAIPAMGKHLEKLAKWLGSFQTIIGIIAIIIGIWGLLN
jgi:nicotinamide riboside transporter PnuC